jgi:hypothetical protein
VRADSCRRVDLLWLAVGLAASACWCLTSAARLGATFDEPIYLTRGLESWRTGSHAGLMRLGTMPLPADVQTLPLYVAERWRGEPWDVTADMATILPWARAANLLFWALLLVYAWRIGRSLAGPRGGRLAVAVLACEPNLLAHASLATTDIALTAVLLAFLYHFRAGREAESRWRRVVLPGLWFGFALAAKASTLMFGPICMTVIEAERCWSSGEFPTAVRRFVRDFFAIGLIGYAVVFVICGCDWRPESSFVAWAQQLRDGSGKMLMVWVAEHLRIFSNAGEGFVRQIGHNMRGHGTFLLGRDYERAVWYYFPVLFTIKLTIPFLVAPLVLLSLRAGGLRNWACATAAVLAAFSLTYRVQIGVRFVLPCIALAGIGLSAAAVRLAESARIVWPVRLAAGTGMVWMAAIAVVAWPDGLRYVNELWGGPADGYRLVSDSNYDWGQGLPELADWQQRKHLADLDVWYFGTDPAVKNLHELKLHTLSLHSADDVREQVAGRRLAVGATVIWGHSELPGHRAAAEFLRTQRPVGRVGTFLIFDFTGMPRAVASARNEDAK